MTTTYVTAGPVPVQQTTYITTGPQIQTTYVTNVRQPPPPPPPQTTVVITQSNGRWATPSQTQSGTAGEFSRTRNSVKM